MAPPIVPVSHLQLLSYNPPHINSLALEHLTGFSVWAIPMTKTSWEEKSAAMRFLWMPFRLERSVRTSARSTKATSSAASDKDTAA